MLNQPIHRRFVLGLRAAPLNIALFVGHSAYFGRPTSIYGDGHFYRGLDRAEVLKQVHCPVLVTHANRFRHPDYGLVDAMDNKGALRTQFLFPRPTAFRFQPTTSSTAIRPFNQVVLDFANNNLTHPTQRLRFSFGRQDIPEKQHRHGYGSKDEERL